MRVSGGTTECDVPVLHGNDGGHSGVNFKLGTPVWLHFALLTLTGEAGNEATAVSFGTRLTRTRWASVALFRLWWPHYEWLARSGKLFNSVPFCSISFHSLSSTRGRRPRMRGFRLRGNDGRIRRRRSGSDAVRSPSSSSVTRSPSARLCCNDRHGSATGRLT